MHLTSLRLRPLCLLVALVAAAAPACRHVPEHARLTADWQPLFDGRDLAGWEQIGPGEFKVENGELVTYGGLGVLWYTREKFGNCQIRVVFRLGSERANSG